MKKPLVAGFVGFPWLAFGCSGPRVQETMLGVTELGWLGMAAEVIFLLLALRLRLRAVAIVCAILLAVHPGWTMSAYNGDCGGTKARLTAAIAAGSVVLIVAGHLRAVRRGQFV